MRHISSTMRFVLVSAGLVYGVHCADLSWKETGVRRVLKSDSVEVVPSGPIKRQSLGEDDAASPDDSPVTVFPVRHLAKAGATSHVASPQTGNQAPPDPASAKEIQRLNHALEMKQHELAEKDIVIAAATKDVKHLNDAMGKSEVASPQTGNQAPADPASAKEIQRLYLALEVQQRQLAEKDHAIVDATKDISRLNDAMGKSEVSRLYQALGIRQKILVEKDRIGASLQEEIDALNTRLREEIDASHYLAYALLFTATQLLAIVTFITLDRRNSLPAWLATKALAKQKAVSKVLDNLD